MGWKERFDEMCADLHIEDGFLRLCFKECVFRVFVEPSNGYTKNKELMTEWFGDIGEPNRESVRKAVFGDNYGGNIERVLDLAGSWSNDLADIIDETAAEDVFGYIFKQLPKNK